MAKFIRISIQGIENVQAKFTSLPQAVKESVSDAINATALTVMSEAKRNLSEGGTQAVDTGRLRASIQVWFFKAGARDAQGRFVAGSGLAADIGTEVEYAPFIEFGTGPLGASTAQQPIPQGYTHHTGNAKMPPLDLIREWCERVGVDPKFAYVIARKIARTGLRARPFLMPALFQEENNFAAAVKAAIESGIR